MFISAGLKNELGEATEKGDVDRVKEILEKVTVSDIKIKREGLGKTPLLIACTYGQIPVVEEFLQVRHSLTNIYFLSYAKQNLNLISY